MRLKKRRIGIGTRLIVGFTLLVLLLAALALYSVRVSQGFLQESVGQGSIFLADEMLKRIDHDIYFRLEELQRYAKDAAMQETVRESNQKFEKLNNVQTYITKKDQAWTSTPAETITPFMQELIDNRLSEELRATFIEIYEKKYGYKVYGEIFITNKYGANVAQTGKTSDYRQDDEEWWQVAKERGWYIGDIEYILYGIYKF